MKIAWIVYGSLEERTGGTIYDAIVVEGLRRSGITVDVLAFPPSGGKHAPALVRKLAALRPDVVVGDELCFRELAVVFRHVRFARRVLLVHHLTCWENAPTRFWEALALRHSDLVITTSHTTRDRLVAEGHRGPIIAVRPGADRLPLVRVQRENGVRLLFVGAIIPRKRVYELVVACAGVPATLRIVGSATRDPAYARRVAALGPDLCGEVDELTLARELAEADALVMPSSLEGYGIAATEAVRAGTPVIATPTLALREALASCVEAVLFASEDLAPALTHFATDGALRQRMRLAAERATMPPWAESTSAFLRALA